MMDMETLFPLSAALLFLTVVVGLLVGRAINRPVRPNRRRKPEGP